MPLLQDLGIQAKAIVLEVYNIMKKGKWALKRSNFAPPVL
jgi:hypothetical protein